MSLSRQIRRAADRKRPKDERRWPTGKTVSRLNEDGSISVLRPTKGWLRTSAPRVAHRIEQARLMAVLMGGLGVVPGDEGAHV